MRILDKMAHLYHSIYEEKAPQSNTETLCLVNLLGFCVKMAQNNFSHGVHIKY